MTKGTFNDHEMRAKIEHNRYLGQDAHELKISLTEIWARTLTVGRRREKIKFWRILFFEMKLIQ